MILLLKLTFKGKVAKSGIALHINPKFCDICRMNSKVLSFGFAFYGLLLLAAAGFCIWANNLTNAFWLGLLGMGVMTWGHFFNRNHYWAFTALIGQLFLNAAVLGYTILTFFQLKAGGRAPEEITETGFAFYSILFALTIVYLLLAAANAGKVKRELL